MEAPWDPAQLLKARLWVARLGESDVNRWWRTDGILGGDGAFVGPRLLPKTHGTGRARVALAVACSACGERHPDPKAQHLFRLDPETEDRLDAHLAERLDAFEWWAETLAALEAVRSQADPGAVLEQAGIVTRQDLALVARLELGPDGRSLPVGSPPTPEEAIRRLAAGFARSKPGQFAVPYVLRGAPR